MIYLPRRALFIHVPRAAGNSITNAIASQCAGNNYDILIGTVANRFKDDWTTIFQTHARACKVKPYIDDWEDIFKFAIYRDEKERLQSIQRLVERDIKQKTYENKACDKVWKKILTNDTERNNFYKVISKQDLNFYTKSENGEDLGIEIFDYSRLEESWGIICSRCGIESCELRHLNSSR